MAGYPLKTTRFKIIYCACWMVWTIAQVCLLRWYEISSRAAMIDSVSTNFLLMGISVLITLSLRYYIPQKNKELYLLCLSGILAGVWVFACRALLTWIHGADMDERYLAFLHLTLPVRLAMGFLITGATCLLSVLWYTLDEQREMEKRKQEAEQLSRSAELFRLRQQLQPHFLFNSLNSINALIGQQPQKARMMIQQLSDFLRGTLRKDENNWIALSEELEHLQLYLEIEKVRFGHRLTTVIRNEAHGAFIPAMLLQPVVENAIKFGLYDTTGDITITINARIAERDLILDIINPYDPATTLPRKGTGFGLSSVQRRLYLLFGRSDLVVTNANANLFTTSIKIPQPV